MTVHRQNLTQLKGNRLQIYTRSDTQQLWWQARTRDPKGRGYLTKSLKTTDSATAMHRAAAWYDDIQTKIGQGLVIKPRSVAQVCDLYIKELEEDVLRGDRPKRHLKDYRTLVDKYVRAFFTGRKMDSIRQKDVEAFVRWRQNYYVTGPGSKVETVTYTRRQSNGVKTVKRPAPKPSTTSHSALGTLATVLRGIFATAVRHDAMLEANVPVVTVAKRTTGAKKTGRRPAFDKTEYDRLITFMRTWCRRAVNAI